MSVYLSDPDLTLHETVRDLSFGFVLPPSAGMPRTGFEPVFPPSGSVNAVPAVTSGPDVADALLDEARNQAEAREHTDPVGGA